MFWVPNCALISLENNYMVYEQYTLHGGSGGIMASIIPIAPLEKFDFKMQH